MGILQAENSVAYTSHNAIKIYIIKQTDISNQQTFETNYASILKKSNEVVSANKFLNLKSNNIQQNREKCKFYANITLFLHCNNKY